MRAVYTYLFETYFIFILPDEYVVLITQRYLVPHVWIYINMYICSNKEMT